MSEKTMSRDESRRSKRARADRDFEMNPGSAILMNDYDDERTLDEEEALEASEDTHNELSHLQKESDMPLKDLLVMYGYGDMSCQDPKAEDEDDDDDEEDDEEDDEDEDDDDPATYEPDLKQFYTEMVKAEENGASVTRPSTAKDETAISAEATSLGPNANAHTTSANVEAKAEDGSAPSTGNLLNDSQPGEIGSSSDNLNSSGTALGPAGSGGGVGGGGGGSSRLLRSVSRPQSEEEEDDCDYSPDEEEWKKTIMVGSDYQAAIPEGLCKYDDALPYENVDKMLWDPYSISEEDVEEFLGRAQVPVVKGVAALPTGHHVRDDEQALYLLLQCGYNLEEALRRRRMNVLPSGETVSLWSEEECHNFESGLRNYGKDFHLIQKNKVRTRSVGELVQFYYLWKKTERHDIFTCKARLEKKKYALHPGVTDYMDRFLDEQEGVRDRSSSPNVHSMLYGDAKRQRTNTAPSAVSDDAKPDDLSTSTTATTTTTTTTTSSSSSSSSTTTTSSEATTATATTTTTTTTTSSTPVNISIVPMPEPISVPLQHHHHHHHHQALDLAKPAEPLWPPRNHLHYHEERQQPTANEQPP